MENLYQEIKDLAFATGAKMVGVAPAERFEHAPTVYQPASFVKGAEGVVVIGVHYPDACVEYCGSHDLQEMKEYGTVQVDMNILLDILAYRTAKLLDDNGFPSLSFSTSHIWRYRPFGEVDRCFTPDFPHRHAAVAAGLAEFGWNGLAITEEYGPRMRFTSIITTAKLPPTPLYNGKTLCDKCMLCVKHCSMNTFRQEVDGMDKVRISDREFKFPHTNKWRCAWAEHFALSLNIDIPEEINEQTVLEAKHRYGVYGGEIGNCLRQCLPPHLRDFSEKDKTDAPQRKTDKKPTDPAELQDILIRECGESVDYLSFIPLEKIPEDIDVARFPDVKAVILIGRACPENLIGPNILNRLGKAVPDNVKDTVAFMNEEVYRTLGITGYKLAMICEEHGYKSLPRLEVSCQRLAALCGFGYFSGDGRIFKTERHGENLQFTAIAVTAPLAFQAQTRKPAPANTNTSTRQQLEDFCRHRGARLFGVTPLDRLSSFPAVKKLQKLFPAEKNVIVIGMSYPRPFLKEAEGAPTGALGPYSFSQYQTYRELGFIALDLCRMLTDAGISAIPNIDLCGSAAKVLNVRGTPPADAMMDRGMIGLLPYAFIPDARSNRFAAMAAGLGTVGYNGSALTPQFGVRQRFIAIMTDMELETDEISTYNPECASCRQCLESCPTQALMNNETETFKIAEKTIEIPKLRKTHCAWAKQFGLSGVVGPGLMGSRTDIKPPENITVRDICEAMRQRDELQDHFPAILEPCVHVCPAAEKIK